ncbi:MAG: hypothetical protein KGL18_09745 [Burkholderiales bacterium]|nr:hypothetical protein [Burkholderiales bacterium]MDE1925597.1 hypothetical protein [Burkholderiales bacterium]MDE2503242.1 hypothetical protein [Burkholderiales bacterium]
MSSCTDRRWRGVSRWPRLALEIAVVLVVKTLLLIVIVKAVAPAPQLHTDRLIERQLLSSQENHR